MRPGRRIAACLAATAVAVACGGGSNGTGPSPAPLIEGTYRLVSYDGASVATLVGRSDGCDRWITAGTLTLRSDRNHERTEVEEDRNCQDPTDNQTRTVTATGTWLAVGRSLTLEEGMGIGSVTAGGSWDGDDTIELTFTRRTLGADVEITRTYER